MISKLTRMLYSNVKEHLTSYQWHAFLSMSIRICFRDDKKTDFEKSTQQAVDMIRRKFKLPFNCDVVIAVDGILMYSKDGRSYL